MELTTWNLPVLALRGLTVFPHMTLTFDVERPISIAALERAMEADQDIFLVTQREIGVNAPEEKDLYTIGTVSHITQILRLGQSSVRVMVEGRQRAHLRRLWQTEPFLQANVEAIPEEPSSEAMRKSPRTEALLRQTYALFGEYAEQAKVSIRNIRRDFNNKLERDEELTEDDVRREQAKVQKHTDEYVAKVEELLKEKEAEVMEI